MNTNRLVRIGMVAAVVFAILGGVLWIGYTFIYQGQVVINTNGQKSTVTITDIQNKQVAKSQDTSFRLNPGKYTVAVESDTSGISKQVDVNSLATTTITLGTSKTLQTTPIASVAMYGAFVSGDSIIGFDPSDMRVKRIDKQGTETDQLTSGQLANQPNVEADLPNEVQSYQPYQSGQALVASGGILYLLSSSSLQEVSTEGIPIDHTTSTPPQFVIAAQPGTASFVVAYKNDVFLYENPTSKPKKIYTSSKSFDSVAYGNGRVAVYFANMPDSRQDLRSQYNGYVVDAVLVDIAHNNQTQSVPGPITHISLSPDGQLAVVQPRHQPAYLYDLQKQQNLTYVDAPVGWPLWTNNTTYVYTKQSHAWQYDTSNRQSALLGTLPNDATSITWDGNTTFIVTAYSGRGQAGVYRLGAASASVSSSQIDTLNQILPYNSSGLFSITFSNVSSPTVVVHTMAPLNDIRELDRYVQQTKQLRQDALDYLTKRGVDLTKLTVTYDPADPLQ